MGKKSNEKSLIVVNEESLFYRIKTFFLGLFRRKEIVKQSQITDTENNVIEANNRKKDAFMEYIRNIENEETMLLKLQQQYDNRLIETKDLSKDQIKALINLYKKQISELSKSNARRKEKIVQYRKRLQTNS